MQTLSRPLDRPGLAACSALAGLALVLFLTAWAGIEFTRNFGRVAAIWAANAMLLAVVLRTPGRTWPWLLAVGYGANVAANLVAGDAPLAALGLAACNTVEVLVCALPLRRRFGRDLDLSRLPDLLAFALFAVALAPVVSATLGSALLAASSEAPFAAVWRIWFISDALGMMVFVPPLLAIRANPLRVPPREAATDGALLALVGLAALLVFTQDRYPLLFLVFPPMVLVAFLTGVAGAAAATLLTSAVAIGMTVAGHGPLVLVESQSVAERVLILQAFLAALVVVAVPVATALAERRRLAEELCASEARYRLLADNTSDVIVLEESFDGRRSYVSPSCRAMLGYEPDVLAAMPAAELIHPEDLGGVRGCHRGLSPERPQVTCTYRVRHRNGHWLWVETVFRLAADAPGGGPLVLATARDASARKASEAALSAARDQAEAAARAKSEFLAAMSHEIRTPLTAVIGMADLLAGRPLDAEAGRYVGAIRGAGQQLLSVVNDILDFLRLGAGRMALHERDFDPAAVLEEVGSILRPAAHDKGIELTLHPPADGGPLRGDAVRLRQILFNLVGNAIKFTSRGCVEVRTALAARPDDRVELRCEVRDTGIGIEAGQTASLFQPFMQADSSASRRFGGTGLGLAICKQLVELMDGRIGHESRPGKGSLFWFEVVLRRGEHAAARHSREAPRRTEPLDILLAEDAPLNRQLLADLIAREGHRLVMSEDGAEFLERACQRRFDVLLVDIQMPVLDGEAAIRRLRCQDGPNRTTPAVALTANVMEDDRQRYLGAGFDAVLHKPLAPADLFAELARVAASAPAQAEPPERAPEPAAEPAVDWPFVAAALDGLPSAAADDFLGRALADARAGLHGLGDQAAEAAARRGLAHRLKGTARSFGLVAIGDAAEAVERALVDGADARAALGRYEAALDATARQFAERRELVP